MLQVHSPHLDLAGRFLFIYTRVFFLSWFPCTNGIKPQGCVQVDEEVLASRDLVGHLPILLWMVYSTWCDGAGIVTLCEVHLFP